MFPQYALSWFDVWVWVFVFVLFRICNSTQLVSVDPVFDFHDELVPEIAVSIFIDVPQETHIVELPRVRKGESKELVFVALNNDACGAKASSSIPEILDTVLQLPPEKDERHEEHESLRHDDLHPHLEVTPTDRSSDERVCDEKKHSKKTGKHFCLF